MPETCATCAYVVGWRLIRNRRGSWLMTPEGQERVAVGVCVATGLGIYRLRDVCGSYHAHIGAPCGGLLEGVADA